MNWRVHYRDTINLLGGIAGCVLAICLVIVVAMFAQERGWIAPPDALAIEQLDLATPITGSAITSYKVLQITLGTTPPVIDWTVVDNTGKTLSGSYNGPLAVTLLSQINTGNFTVTSLQKKIILQLQADGKLGAGTVTGTP